MTTSTFTKPKRGWYENHACFALALDDLIDTERLSDGEREFLNVELGEFIQMACRCHECSTFVKCLTHSNHYCYDPACEFCENDASPKYLACSCGEWANLLLTKFDESPLCGSCYKVAHENDWEAEAEAYHHSRLTMLD